MGGGGDGEVVGGRAGGGGGFVDGRWLGGRRQKSVCTELRTGTTLHALEALARGCSSRQRLKVQMHSLRGACRPILAVCVPGGYNVEPRASINHWLIAVCVDSSSVAP